MPTQSRPRTTSYFRFDWPNPTEKLARADWSSYATAYDLLVHYNPAYQALLEDFSAFLTTIETPRVVYDVGGGTGNYTQVAAQAFPSSEIRLVEPDASMMSLAKSKLALCNNITYDLRPFENIDAPGTADLVVCVHALYAMPHQTKRLGELARLLRPGGWLYLIDLGRCLDLADWRDYLFKHLKSEHGLAGALRIIWQGRQIAKQNRAILEAQKSGVYWLHSETEIAAAVSATGLQICRQQKVYRGQSDLLVCRAEKTEL